MLLNKQKVPVFYVSESIALDTGDKRNIIYLNYYYTNLFKLFELVIIILKQAQQIAHIKI